MTRPLPPHSDRAQAAITTELRRVSVEGHPDRPELEGPFIDLPRELQEHRT